jgi:hypothetical protein
MMLRLIGLLGLGLSGLAGTGLFLLVWAFGYEHENSDVERGEWLLLLFVVGGGSLAAWVATYGLAALSRRSALVGSIGQAVAAVSLLTIGIVRGGSDDTFAVALALILSLDLAVVFWAWPASESQRGHSALAGRKGLPAARRIR